jgi:TolB protein
MIYLFLLAISLISHLHSRLSEDTDPIVVQLSGETALLPTYISLIKSGENSFSESYLRTLVQVLTFDMNHNGLTYVEKTTPAKENLAHSLSQDLSFWVDHGTYYVIQLSVRDKQLGVRLLLINSNEIARIDGLNLSGNLSQDRRIIHALSDKIFKTLFHAEGIASARILYTLKKQDPLSKKWISEVFEADYDGGNPRQITHTQSYHVMPSYVPPSPGQRSGSFVCVSYQIGQPKIYLGDLQTGKTQRFSLLKGNQLMPCFSLKRDKVAFICDVTGNPDLFLQDFDPEKGPLGKPRQIFTTYKATQGSPSFSPDGKKIAFVSNKDGHPRIYVIDIPAPGVALKDIKAKLISKAVTESSAPAWSPDGKKIAYCAMTKGTRQIWVYDFETDTEQQLTCGPGNKENPAWAPNSLHIMFNSTEPNQSELYLTHLLHPQVTPIPLGSGEKHFPAWEIKQ